MSNETTPTARRGRPSGSNSFTRMRLSDLVDALGDKAVIPVSKVWLRDNGFSTEENLTPVKLVEAPEPIAPEAKVEFVLTTFDEDDEKVVDTESDQ